MKYKFVSLKPSSDGVHKYDVVIKADDKNHVIKFGAKGCSDYTKHKDDERKERYLNRHKAREDWSITGVLSAGFWSRWVLWNKTTLYKSVEDVIERFKL